MNRTRVMIGGALIWLSAFPHALLGWPPLAAQLRAASVDPEVISGLAVGWYFGSAAMFALGGVILVAAADLSTSRWAGRAAMAVGVVYVVFGVAALLYRNFSPHFLLFIAIGALLIVGSLGARKVA